MPLQQLAYVYFNVEGVRPCSSMVSGINLLHSSYHRIAVITKYSKEHEEACDKSCLFHHMA
jgi:hypothetical protein